MILVTQKKKNESSWGPENLKIFLNGIGMHTSSFGNHKRRYKN